MYQQFNKFMKLFLAFIAFTLFSHTNFGGRIEYKQTYETVKIAANLAEKTPLEIYKDSLSKSAKRLNVPTNWLLVITYNESMFNAKAKNKLSTATGILQFTSGTAKRLNTSVTALRKMTAVQQIPYAEKYMQMGIDLFGAYKSETDMYIWCLLPYKRPLADKPNAVLMKKGDDYYALNSGLDSNGDGMVQVYEITKRLKDKAKQMG